MRLNYLIQFAARMTTLGIMATLVWLALPPARAEANRPFEPRYRAIYQMTKTNWLAAPGNTPHAWQFARATFDLAEFSTNDTQRAQLAEEGIRAARSGLDQEPKNAQAHYYRALNLGQLARTQLLGALKLVKEMEQHFKTAAELDPGLDHGGPDRNLGILYREAPGWPASIGSRSKARKHLEKAVHLHPDFPANQLELLQAHLDWKDRRNAEQVLPGVRSCMADVETKFSGEQWAWARDGWQRFWEELQARWNRLAN
jgi:tetratricopeptide (TPR) repeat protein